MNRTRAGQNHEVIADALLEMAILMVRHLVDRDLSLTAASTLGRLGREEPVRLTALATAEGIAQPSMTQLVKRLEQQGLVRRVSDPEDGRVALVALTDAGQELRAERQRAYHARLAGLAASLPAEDEEVLATAMRAALPVVRQLIHNATKRLRPSGAPAAP
ncbi:MarR family winged helix-turn-helix transcriptional regulator [Streptomyces sp. NPDC048516]|uniref:MarR family winged helix-turn-helix transcriptional regulator n=1 Tax=Streptomyces sp. NPDC048516 TaxID=3365565 RepID=UPI0037158C02